MKREGESWVCWIGAHLLNFGRLCVDEGGLLVVQNIVNHTSLFQPNLTARFKPLSSSSRCACIHFVEGRTALWFSSESCWTIN